MSTYDMIKLEGKEEGRIEGKKEGRIEGKKEGRIAALKATITRILRKYPNWSNEEIAELTGASVEFIKKVKEELK